MLSPDTAYARDYARDPYTGYASSESLYFAVSSQSSRYHPKEQVPALEIDGTAKAYPFNELARVASTTVNDRLGDTTVRIHFDADQPSAAAFDADGNEIPGVTSYWFAWYAFHPETEVFVAGQ